MRVVWERTLPVVRCLAYLRSTIQSRAFRRFKQAYLTLFNPGEAYSGLGIAPATGAVFRALAENPCTLEASKCLKSVAFGPLPIIGWPNRKGLHRVGGILKNPNSAFGLWGADPRLFNSIEGYLTL
jgi:hypothetical protein